MVLDGRLGDFLVPVAAGTGTDQLNLKPFLGVIALFLGDVVGQGKDRVVDFDLGFLEGLDGLPSSNTVHCRRARGAALISRG